MDKYWTTVGYNRDFTHFTNFIQFCCFLFYNISTNYITNKLTNCYCYRWLKKQEEFCCHHHATKWCLLNLAPTFWYNRDSKMTFSPLNNKEGILGGPRIENFYYFALFLSNDREKLNKVVKISPIKLVAKKVILLSPRGLLLPTQTKLAILTNCDIISTVFIKLVQNFVGIILYLSNFHNKTSNVTRK